MIALSCEARQAGLSRSCPDANTHRPTAGELSRLRPTTHTPRRMGGRQHRSFARILSLPPGYWELVIKLSGAPCVRDEEAGLRGAPEFANDTLCVEPPTRAHRALHTTERSHTERRDDGICSCSLNITQQRNGDSPPSESQGRHFAAYSPQPRDVMSHGSQSGPGDAERRGHTGTRASDTRGLPARVPPEHWSSTRPEATRSTVARPLLAQEKENRTPYVYARKLIFANFRNRRTSESTNERTYTRSPSFTNCLRFASPLCGHMHVDTRAPTRVHFGCITRFRKHTKRVCVS